MTTPAPEPASPLPELLPGEELVLVQEINDPAPAQLPSSTDELQRLTGARTEAEVGAARPVLASLAMNGRSGGPDAHRYEAVFGRDSLRAAIDLVESYPRLARTTLLTLAKNQGITFNDEREEEPGRIPHEIRDPAVDPKARELTETRGWGWPYYGEVDGTPEFIRTLAAYCRTAPDAVAFWKQLYTGRDGEKHTIADAFQAATGWIERRMSANKEGLLEYQRTNPGGIENQVWKDSLDSYFHADGALANHERGIASIEVQRVAYDALLDAAELYEKYIGDAVRAQELRSRADGLGLAIMDLFWTDERGGYFVLGTDRDGDDRLRQLKIKTSNMGHLLHSRLLETDDADTVARREAVISQLFSPEMMGLNGVRTLATSECRYRPGAYHNGSVWIWDNYVISQGLSQLGYHTLAHYINDKLLDDISSTHRYPEYLRGDDDPDCRLNTHLIDVFDHTHGFLNHLEQPPQDIQAWSVAAIQAIKIHRSRGQHQTTDPRKVAFEQHLLKA